MYLKQERIFINKNRSHCCMGPHAVIHFCCCPVLSLSLFLVLHMSPASDYSLMHKVDSLFRSTLGSFIKTTDAACKLSQALPSWKS